jgi:hypothetical protein
MVHLTYEELGERLGLSPQAARMRARRRRWAVTKGNDDRARVSVDESELVAEGERALERSPARSANEAAQEAERWRTLAEERGMALARAEGENTALRERIDDLRVQMDRERTRADRLEAELRQLHGEARRPWWQRWLKG